MEQPYYDREEKKPLLIQQSRKPGSWAEGTLAGTAPSAFFVSRGKTHLFSSGHCIIQVNTIPKDSHVLTESLQEPSELVLSCAHCTDEKEKLRKVTVVESWLQLFPSHSKCDLLLQCHSLRGAHSVLWVGSAECGQRRALGYRHFILSQCSVLLQAYKQHTGVAIPRTAPLFPQQRAPWVDSGGAGAGTG